MGILRGALVTFITILLFGSLLFTGACLTFYSSLDYGALKPEMRNVVHDILIKEGNLDGTIDDNLKIMTTFCNNHESYNQALEDGSIEIPCSVIKEGPDAIVNYTIDDLIEKNYYKEYNCSFVDCFSQEQTPFFVFSKQSQDYWNSMFYSGLVFSLILCGLLFLSVEKRGNYPFILGILFIIPSFLFLGAGKLVPMIIGWEYANVFALFFTQAYIVFLIFIILGVVLFTLGILLKFLSFGQFISKIFHKEEKVTKEDVRKEVKEAIREERKPKKPKKSRKK